MGAPGHSKVARGGRGGVRGGAMGRGGALAHAEVAAAATGAVSESSSSLASAQERVPSRMHQGTSNP